MPAADRGRRRAGRLAGGLVGEAGGELRGQPGPRVGREHLGLQRRRDADVPAGDVERGRRLQRVALGIDVGVHRVGHVRHDHLGDPAAARRPASRLRPRTPTRRARPRARTRPGGCRTGRPGPGRAAPRPRRAARGRPRRRWLPGVLGGPEVGAHRVVEQGRRAVLGGDRQRGGRGRGHRVRTASRAGGSVGCMTGSSCSAPMVAARPVASATEIRPDPVDFLPERLTCR